MSFIHTLAIPFFVFTSATKQEVVKNYAGFVSASYEQAVMKSRDLQRAVEIFVAAPSEKTHGRLKDKWTEARAAYSPTEAFRFYGGPIDNLDGIEIEARMNAWPMQESYLDEVLMADGKTTAATGVIAQTEKYPQITKELLISLNQANDEEANVSLGYHAIEFLIWGQDTRHGLPGNRSWKDYSPTHSPLAERRKKTLQLITQQLVEDLEAVTLQWRDGQGNYRKNFEKNENQKESLANLFSGIATLVGFELASERIYAPFDSRDQEDEQSCFSDETHFDIFYNLQGAERVYLIASPLVQQKNPQLDQTIKAGFKNLKVQHEALFKEKTFEQVITAPDDSAERSQLQEMILSLQTLGDHIRTAGSELGLELKNAG